MELLSKYKSTTETTVFKTVSKRTELWGSPQPQPPPAEHANRDKSFWKPKSTLRFDPKVPGHKSVLEVKPFRVPDGYRNENL